jgi:hypothetical protein
MTSLTEWIPSRAPGGIAVPWRRSGQKRRRSRSSRYCVAPLEALVPTASRLDKSARSRPRNPLEWSGTRRPSSRARVIGSQSLWPARQRRLSSEKALRRAFVDPPFSGDRFTTPRPARIRLAFRQIENHWGGRVFDFNRRIRGATRWWHWREMDGFYLPFGWHVRQRNAVRRRRGRACFRLLGFGVFVASPFRIGATTTHFANATRCNSGSVIPALPMWRDSSS